MPNPVSGHSGESGGPRVLVLAPDLQDSALWRRVAMLRAGGAEVRVLGFSRGGAEPAGPAEVLGQTRNGAMLQRALAVARTALPLMARLWRAETEVILARNLEMLVLARLARLAMRGRPRVVYEVLDIHRLMLGRGGLSQVLRALERRLAAGADLLLTSSPGFVRAYFRPLARLSAPVLIVENRCFDPASDAIATAPQVTMARAPAAPLVIGWFGILRCAQSLACLDSLTRAEPGRYRIVLRGRPARDVLPEFDQVLAANPDLHFAGPYRNPEDLAAIYGAVDLVWAIDRYEAGGNSDWLLPNRLYEGCLHGAVPLTLQGTETARRAATWGVGLTLPALDAAAAAGCLGALTPATLAALRTDVQACDPGLWRANAQDARALVAALVARGTPPPRSAASLPLSAEGPPA